MMKALNKYIKYIYNRKRLTPEKHDNIDITNTVWKSQSFSVNDILREINIDES